MHFQSVKPRSGFSKQIERVRPIELSDCREHGLQGEFCANGDTFCESEINMVRAHRPESVAIPISESRDPRRVL